MPSPSATRAAPSASAARVEVLRQGQLEEPENDTDIHPVVYVNVRDNTTKVFGLRAQVETWLQRHGYTIVPNPSEAGYILQIVVLSAGATSPEKVRQVVAAGYDAPSQLEGKGGTAMVADILLVQRENRSTVLYATGGRRFETSEALGDVEARLDPQIFFRCHKSYIINLNVIDNITPYGRWTYVVHLTGTTQDALITHEKYEELEKMFS